MGSEDIQSVQLVEVLHLRSSEVDEGMDISAEIYLINKQAPRILLLWSDTSSSFTINSTEINELMANHLKVRGHPLGFVG